MENIDKPVRDYFTLENLGVRHEDIVLESRDDIRAREILARTTRKIGLVYSGKMTKLISPRAVTWHCGDY